MANQTQQVLVIKHGALGDIVIASAGFKAIRSTHPHAHITCLTSVAFASLMRNCPWFDDVVVDKKPRITSPHQWWRLLKILRKHRYDWVYDLQASTRSSFYLRLLRKPRGNVSAVIATASHSYTDPARHTRHAHDNLQRQLAIAGIQTVGLPDISWLNEPIKTPPSPYALIVAGGAAHRPQKRWPAEHYAQLASHLHANGITAVLIGSNSEQDVLHSIATLEPHSINLCGQTTLAQLATLARGAAFACGNDTGPMHIIAATGCASLVLFSSDSTPARSAPIGDHVRCLQRDNLHHLMLHDVINALDTLPKRSTSLDN